MQRDFSDATTKSENLGIRVVGFLLNRPADFALLLASTGLTYEDFKRTPYGRDQLMAALEFLVTNETLLLRFARATGRSPEAVYEALRVMSRPSWAHRRPIGGEADGLAVDPPKAIWYTSSPPASEQPSPRREARSASDDRSAQQRPRTAA